MIICLLMTLFIVKHFVCDFCLQTQTMLTQKGTYGAPGGIEHALVHTIGTLIVLLIFLESVELSLMLAVVDGLLHYHIDWVKMRYTRNLTPADDKFWIWIGADQMLHYLTYVSIIYILLE